MRRLLSLVLLFFFLSAGSTLLAQADFRDGDIIFIVNPAGQGRAIQLATGSEFTHVGIIFIEDGKPYVYHAIEPVSKNTVDEFIAMSADGNYTIRRLKKQEDLTASRVLAMRKDATSLLGRHYDLAFSWNDKELYCSEFVWKLFQRHLQIAIGEPKPLKYYNIGNPVVREAIEERYGTKIPLEEKMISPGDIFTSELVK